MANDHYYIGRDYRGFTVQQRSTENNSVVNNFASEPDSIDDITATPDGSIVFVDEYATGSPRHQYVRAYDSNSGDMLWERDFIGGNGNSVYDPDNGVLWSEAPDGSNDQRKLVKLDPSDGTTLDTITSHTGGGLIDVYGGEVYHLWSDTYANDEGNRYVTKYDADGNEIWTTEGSYNVLTYDKSPISVNDTFVVVGTSGQSRQELIWLDAETGVEDSRVEPRTLSRIEIPVIEILSNNDVLIAGEYNNDSAAALYDYDTKDRQFYQYGPSGFGGMDLAPDEQTYIMAGDGNQFERRDLTGSTTYTGNWSYGSTTDISAPRLAPPPEVETVGATQVSVTTTQNATMMPTSANKPPITATPRTPDVFISPVEIFNPGKFYYVGKQSGTNTVERRSAVTDEVLDTFAPQPDSINNTAATIEGETIFAAEDTGSDYVIRGYDRYDGSLLWTRSFSVSTGNIFYEPRRGNLYADTSDGGGRMLNVLDPETGGTNGVLQRNHTEGVVTADSTGVYHLYKDSSSNTHVRKYDVDGNELWTYDGNLSLNSGRNGAIDANGDKVAVCRSGGSIVYLSASNGTVLTEIPYGEYPQDIQINSDDEVLITHTDNDLFVMEMYDYDSESQVFSISGSRSDMLPYVMFGRNENSAYLSLDTSIVKYDLSGNLQEEISVPDGVSSLDYPTLAGPTDEIVDATKASATTETSAPTTIYNPVVDATGLTVATEIRTPDVIINYVEYVYQPTKAAEMNSPEILIDLGAERLGITTTLNTAETEASAGYPSIKPDVEAVVSTPSIGDITATADYTQATVTVTESELTNLRITASQPTIVVVGNDMNIYGTFRVEGSIVEVGSTTTTTKSESLAVSDSDKYVTVQFTVPPSSVKDYIKMGYGETTKTYPDEYNL